MNGKAVENILRTVKKEMANVENGADSKSESMLFMSGYLKALCDTGLISKEEFSSQLIMVNDKLRLAQQRYFTNGEK